MTFDFSTIVIVWFIIGLVLILAEFIIPGAILSFLGIAAIFIGLGIHIGMISSIITAIVWWFIVSLILVFTLRSFVLRFMPGDYKVEQTDEDEDAKGTIVSVIETIRPETNGRIKYLETSWEAQSQSLLEINMKAVITGRKGNIWIVKAID